ncbi:MAG: LacI family DNA-binding transcriptional regulator [Lachnospiraceae bacterium]|nr:LacI family DNA-binding transcriptional regulator [Lachnospiraceae bacterium]MDD3617575.1 LacI family DNA-binding transcriptional regulator [Lachnospiraceae bacterium]
MKSNKITVSQIAKTTGLSPATISRVMNHPELVKQETLESVQTAMLNLGYDFQKATVLPVQKKKIIILNVPDTENIFYDEIIKGAKTSAHAHGCHILVNECPIESGTIKEFCDLIKCIDVAGVILLNQVETTLLEQIHAIAPLIQCCEYNKSSNYPYVSIDDIDAAEKATNHLLSCGRNKIAFVNGPLSFKYAIERREGFLSAMNTADTFVPKNWMIQLPKVNYDMAYAAISRILNEETIPNAFFMSSDIFAMALVRAAHHFHLKVPKDIMVVGFDDISFSSIISPTLTTIAQPSFQLGYSACEMLIEIILNPSSTPKSLLLGTNLIIRESTSIQAP